jgi:uncharacterized membrane protein
MDPQLLDAALSAAALSAAGLIAGAFVFVQVVINPAVGRLPEEGYAAYHRGVNRTADPFMPRLVFFALLLTAGYAARLGLRGAGPLAVGLAAVGLAGIAGVIAITVRGNVPINRSFDGESAPPGWAALRERWNRLHARRTACALLAFAALLAAALASPIPQASGESAVTHPTDRPGP